MWLKMNICMPSSACLFNNKKIWNLNLFQDVLYILQSVHLMIKIASAVHMLFRYD